MFIKAGCEHLGVALDDSCGSWQARPWAFPIELNIERPSIVDMFNYKHCLYRLLQVVQICKGAIIFTAKL